MKTRLWILFVILITITALFVVNFFMSLYHYGQYFKIDDYYVFHCIVDGRTAFCDNTSIRIIELFGLI